MAFQLAHFPSIDRKALKASLIALVTVLLLLIHENAYPQKLTTEDKIKASYIYNFIRFINWPPNNKDNSSQPINVCGLSETNHFFKAFRPVTGKRVRGRALTLHKITHPNQIAQCHLLYIDKAKQQSFSKFLPLINKHQILSVSDINSFCMQGGMICLVKSKGRISVEINLKVARAAGFNISSNLLEVATIVSSP